jgi:hypothetical protein
MREATPTDDLPLAAHADCCARYIALSRRSRGRRRSPSTACLFRAQGALSSIATSEILRVIS